MQFIKNQEWRFATKSFDPAQKINKESLDLLKRSIQLSVSSYGLQLYKVLIIEDADIRKKLVEASWGQSQITEASHLFLFCHQTGVDDSDVDQFIQQSIEEKKGEAEGLQKYGAMMKGTIKSMSIKEQDIWTKHQTYIALANLLSACAELKIDACPMEGFDAEQYSKILDTPSHSIYPSVLVAVGYRADKNHQDVKVRKSFEKLFVEM